MTLKFELTPDIQSLVVNYENRGPLSKVSQIVYVLHIIFLLISLLKRLRVTVNGHKCPLVDFDNLSDTESESEEVCRHVSPYFIRCA
jgi:hypothetical protein